jgi:glyoxylase-like metal-dependent hydrolase (beta-lactamase superfamily II)
MWDAGAIPDSAFKSNQPAAMSYDTDHVTSPRPLLPQLAALGYPPQTITYVAFSHYHFDHIANADAFSRSTWLVHATERDAMFAASPKQQAAYDQLRHSKTVILPNSDYDVFRDGTVVIKYAPGHTPGHQVLALKLPKTGPVLIAGDLWHYAAERKATRAPEGEANGSQTLASRAAMETYLKQSGAQLWIEHDPSTFHRLKKAPDYIQ